ncbi:MAG: mobile mystery protein A [Alphaproteobacteria bacterium]|nr:mobile mystery protein A [Alphaproteobacteria bacterium]
MKKSLARARHALDLRLAPLRPADRFAVPPKGWVRAIRDALGMSGAQLAARLSVKPPSVVSLEQSEAAGTIRLDTLRKAAAALDCQLVYAFVPNKPLEDRVAERARARALEAIGSVSHSMAMEGQTPPDDELEQRIAVFISQTLRERDLWNDG